MPICETCGNDYDKAFQVILNGKNHTFDSFECAIQTLAPTCPHCGTHVVGHGVEKDDAIFCCAHCAKQEGVPQFAIVPDHTKKAAANKRRSKHGAADQPPFRRRRP